MAELTADDMLYPRVGQIKAEAVWPAATMAKSVKLAKAALQELLVLGYAQADTELLVEPARKTGAMRWTAYLAYRGRLQQMGGLPGSVDVRDEGSSSYTADQRALMERLMNDELAAYQGIVAGQVEAGTAAVPRTSRSVRFDIELV